MKYIQEEICYKSYNQDNTIVAYLNIPDDQEIKGIVQIVHGMAEHMGRYTEFISFLCNAGFVVCGHDQLGHGKTAFKEENLGLIDQSDRQRQVLVEDVRYLQLAIQRRFKGVPYFLLGHSMGSFVSRVYAAKYGDGLSGLILSATGAGLGRLAGLVDTFIQKDIKKRGGEYRNASFDRIGFGGFNKQFSNTKTPFDWLSRDEKQVLEYMEDPYSGFVFTNNGFYLVSQIIEEANHKDSFDKINRQLPILFLSGSKDPVASIGKGVRSVALRYQNIGVQNVELRIYEDARHEVLQEINREEVYGDILYWITEGYQQEHHIEK